MANRKGDDLATLQGQGQADLVFYIVFPSEPSVGLFCIATLTSSPATLAGGN